MKCPKCHYLSFDPEPRCRNCGYTLTLDSDLEIRPEATTDVKEALPDLALRKEVSAPNSDLPKRRQVQRAPVSTSEPLSSSVSMPGPFDEFTVAPRRPTPDDPQAAAELDSAEQSRAPEVGEEASGASPIQVAAPRRPPSAPIAGELPLFVRGIAEDAPPAPVAGERRAAATDSDARAPSARAVPEAVASAPSPRRQPRRRETPPKPIGPLDRDLLEGLQRIEEKARRAAVAELSASSSQTDEVGAGRRFMAAALDAGLVAGLSAGIVAMTLRWVDLDWGRWTELPAAPVTVFLVLIVAVYLFLFTAAGGQTAGKMLLGIRVVDAGPTRERVTIRQALYRSLLAIPSVLAFGAGFVPALTGEHLALHDRLTGTRVVRV